MLSLYLHLPFCLSKCRYCAFNSRPLPSGGARPPLVGDYLGALHRELQLASASQPGETLRSIYFGGGTPTVLDPSCLCSLLEQTNRYFHWNEAIEITVEANPATVSRSGLAELRRAGVNRLSLGAQSFSAPELRLLGRAHDVDDTRAAWRDARVAGFDNLNLDLIYGLPGQAPDNWRETLLSALELCPEHLSVYGLKLEPGTPLAEDVAAGRLQECGEEEQFSMWSETQRLTASAGLGRYEISNYALPGRQSRHNLTYWRNLPYLALGAGASGYLNSDGSHYVRYANDEDVEGYVASLDRGELPRVWEEHQTPEQERADTVMMGLRLTGGLDRSDFQDRFGQPFEFFYGGQLAAMTGDGLMGSSDTAVFLTERGLLLSNYVLSRFI